MALLQAFIISIVATVAAVVSIDHGMVFCNTSCIVTRADGSSATYPAGRWPIPDAVAVRAVA